MSSIECYCERETARLTLFKHFYAERIGQPGYPEKMTMPEFHKRYQEFIKDLDLQEEDETPTEEERIQMHVKANEAFQTKGAKP